MWAMMQKFRMFARVTGGELQAKRPRCIARAPTPSVAAQPPARSWTGSRGPASASALRRRFFDRFACRGLLLGRCLALRAARHQAFEATQAGIERLAQRPDQLEQF